VSIENKVAKEWGVLFKYVPSTGIIKAESPIVPKVYQSSTTEGKAPAKIQENKEVKRIHMRVTLIICLSVAFLFQKRQYNNLYMFNAAIKI